MTAQKLKLPKLKSDSGTGFSNICNPRARKKNAESCRGRLRIHGHHWLVDTQSKVPELWKTLPSWASVVSDVESETKTEKPIPQNQLFLPMYLRFLSPKMCPTVPFQRSCS